jgi:hypothetical protein
MVQMKTSRLKSFLPALGMSAALLLAEGARADIYEINVNTSSVQGTSGYLDFQFNPGDTPYDAATATITNFTGDATLTGPLLPDFGAVTGTLPGTVVIGNIDALNEHTEGIIYGSFFDVFVNLDIPTVSGTATGGNTFALSVWDTNFAPVLTGDPLVQINLDATTGDAAVIDNSVGGVAVVSSVTPEPGYLLLVGSALCGLVAVRLRRI